MAAGPDGEQEPTLEELSRELATARAESGQAQ
jgi:hypothetical protein